MSPLLANVYLHYAFDLWVQQWRRQQASGEVIVVRYADDFIVGFQRKSDATRFRDELERRLRKFALELHPEKTRLMRFGRFAAADRQIAGEGKPETFEFLGFTHICGKGRTGSYALMRWTSARRMRARLKELKGALHRRRHLPIPEQGQWLGSVIRGYFAYHAIPTNIDRLCSFRTQAIRHWHRALQRRSQRARMDWVRTKQLVDRWLPPARILHPWPEDRFDARTRGKSRVR
ncbi:reverse transcriptase domain-containing protein [Polyangium sp. y55x31]|nr:reverse transcriptase domain-containing protein [Polyangium sp. y55x31]